MEVPEDQVNLASTIVAKVALSPGLYVVATPIGNLSDISQRAIDILRNVDTIAAEDTRHSSHLLRAYQIQTPCIAFHEHNERHTATRIVEQIQAGGKVALISDAGTPLISDPGYHLIKLAQEASLKIVPIPGPSALIAALSVSGLPSDRFVFEGFLPSKRVARQKRLTALGHEPRTMIFYEAPHRVLSCLQDMTTVFGESRMAVLAREISKTFETIKQASLADLVEWVAQDENQQRGEIVLLVEGDHHQPEVEDSNVDSLLAILLEELSTKQAATMAAKITGQKKKVLYERALTILNKK
jgi:16S rRNA (cytidine1402-2'-O)-methyltransferase